MMIENTGPNVGPKDIEAIESELDAKLPSTYRDFLSRYNGGTPCPDIVDVPGAPGTPTDVQVFFGIDRPVASSDLSWNLSVVADRCPGLHVLPIACDSGGNLFCLKVESGVAAEIIYCDLDAADCACYAVAPSFSDFVAGLRSFGQ